MKLYALEKSKGDWKKGIKELNIRLFVNGLDVKSSSDFKVKIPVQNPIEFLGADFLGKMDEVRIWDIARTQSEIHSTMSQKLTGNETGLIAYYPMDLTADYKLKDLSPNSNARIPVDIFLFIM